MVLHHPRVIESVDKGNRGYRELTRAFLTPQRVGSTNPNLAQGSAVLREISSYGLSHLKAV